RIRAGLLSGGRKPPERGRLQGRARTQLSGQCPSKRLDFPAGYSETMIGRSACNSRTAFHNIKPIHQSRFRLVRYLSTGGKLPRITQMSGASPQEIGVHAEYRVRMGEVVIAVERLPEGEDRAGSTIVPME